MSNAHILAVATEAITEARKLLKEGRTELAELLLNLAGERIAAFPTEQAREFELRWLCDYIRRQSWCANVSKTTDDGNEQPIEWEIASTSQLEDGSFEAYVITVTPRLGLLLKGELPSERAFREGRVP